MLLHHITLATGQDTVHRLDTLDPAAVDACRPLLVAGGPVPAFPAFRVTSVEGGRVWTLYRGADPIVTCGHGAGTADPTWTKLADLQARFMPVTAAAPAGRWLAVVLLPGLLTTARTDIEWLGDFERCMAAAYLIPT